MTNRKLLIAALTGAGAFATAHLIAPAVAHAQNATTGAVQGIVKDEKGGALPGVTVIVTSNALGQTQTQITDEKGYYKVTDLPPGDYTVTFYYLDFTIERAGVHVGLDTAAPVYQTIDTAAAVKKGEVIKIQRKTPTVDTTSTTQGITIDKNYLNNIPVPGRTFDSVLGAAAGSSTDALGVSFSGSTSLENQYFVDGVNTTGLTYGTVGSPIVNDFIEEIEVITGGYNAEYGRATGGIVNVVTKSGSNEFKGSVFGFYQPGFLTAPVQRVPVNASTIDFTGNQAYIADVGFELGGPIIKDKLWFFVGFDPSVAAVDYTRITKRETDCRQVQTDGSLSDCKLTNGISLPRSQGGFADGVPDVDPKTGFFITDDLDSEVRRASSRAYNIIAKLNYAANPENQGQVTFSALPGSSKNPGLLGPANQGGAFSISSLTTDISGKWTSKFNDNKTEVEATIGWHRDHVSTDALDKTFENKPFQALEDGNLGVWGPGFGAESQKTNTGCVDNTPSDPYKNITNCPMTSEAYTIGGYGGVARDTEDRYSAKIGLTQRLKAAGNHEIKAGFDAEDNRSDKARLYSGGGFIENDVGGQEIITTRWVQLARETDPVMGPPNPNSMQPRFDNVCHTPNPVKGGPTGGGTLTFQCDYLSGTIGSPGTQVVGETFNWAGYLRDSWQIKPNLTLNVGIRYEDQRLRYADFLQNTTDVLTGDKLGTNAIHLDNMWAPRVGLLYDWTKEGRGKLYAHWGRFYESIPMDINDRSFGGEVQYQQKWSTKSPGQCGGKIDPRIGGVNGEDCLAESNDAAVASNGEQLIGSSGVLIEPGIKPEYLDEFIAGAEYEVLDDLKLGVQFQNRNFGRIIEDVSTDGANTYIISNPGEFSDSEANKLQDTIDRTTDPKEKSRLEHQLSLYEGIRIFDKPQREYNALQFTLTRRFSKALYIQGSYTYSRTEGNYPGSYSPDNGQVDPNISSQYDLIELLSNRIGPLPQDRPHYIKIDGYYTFDLKKAGQITTGISFRARSGIPENALGSHYLYGPNESFLLPRGELGRSDFDHAVNLHIGYGHKLGHGMTLELIGDLFNLYDRQGSADVDNTYALPYRLASTTQPGSYQNANPVSGGTYDDLIWVKTINQQGVETSQPIGRNPDFHNTDARYAPLTVRLGARLTF